VSSGTLNSTIPYHACIDPHQTGSVGEGSDHLQLVKFWPSCTPGKGSAAGRIFLAPPYYSQRAMFASLRALFSLTYVFYGHHSAIDRPIQESERLPWKLAINCFLTNRNKHINFIHRKH